MKLLPLVLLLMLGSLLTMAAGCGGYGSGNGMKPGTPAIAMLTPDNAMARGEQFTLTITGTGFTGNSVVYWNSGTLTTTFMSAQALTAKIPANDIESAGSATVYVKNPGTGAYASGVNSNSMTFTIQ